MKNKKLQSLIIFSVSFIFFCFYAISASKAENIDSTDLGSIIIPDVVAIDPETFIIEELPIPNPASPPMVVDESIIDPETFIKEDTVVPLLPLDTRTPVILEESLIVTDVPLKISSVIEETPILPILNVTVNVINDNGGLNKPNDFIIDVTGANANPSNFRGNETGTNIVVGAGENYSVSVSTLTYSVSLSPDCKSSVASLDEVKCLITLDDIARLESSENSPNFILNPSVEVANNEYLPVSWIKGGFGNNDGVLTYPVEGVGGGTALNIKITSYTDGDRKWYFSEVPVLSGQSYMYTNNYKSDVASELIAQYFDASHNHLSYGGYISVPSSTSSKDYWDTVNQVFIPPVGASYMTVFHSLKGVGYLTTDNYSLTQVPNPKQFLEGFVTLTFDDGLDSQFNNAIPKLNEAGMKGVFYLISHAVSGVAIKNSSLEKSGTSGFPSNWSKSGSLDATYTFPVPAHQGMGAKVSSNSLESNAAWYFEPISVINDSIYSFSEWYKSSTNSEIVALVTKNNGSIIQAEVIDKDGNTLGSSIELTSTSDTWKKVDALFYIPIDTKNVTILNRLKGVGELTVDDLSLGALENIDIDQVRFIKNSGHEIGLHTQSHKDLTAIPLDAVMIELNESLSDFLENGFGNINSLSYPYGLYNQDVKDISMNAGYTSGRTVTPGFNGKDTNKFNLFTQSLGADTSLSSVKNWINQAKNDRTWLVLVFHGIESDLTKYPFGTTPDDLQSIINYLKDNNIAVRTIEEGIDSMGLNIQAVTLQNISITTLPSKLNYKVGDTLDLTGLVVAGNYSDNSTKVLNVTLPDVSGFNSSKASEEQVLTIMVAGKSITYKINVIESEQKAYRRKSGSYIINNTFKKLEDNSINEKVLGVSVYKFMKNLRKGMTHNEIKELQTKLKNEAIFFGPITGYFGNQTLTAVKIYQAKRGLHPDGIVGPITRNMLNNF